MPRRRPARIERVPATASTFLEAMRPVVAATAPTRPEGRYLFDFDAGNSGTSLAVCKCTNYMFIGAIVLSILWYVCSRLRRATALHGLHKSSQHCVGRGTEAQQRPKGAACSRTQASGRWFAAGASKALS
jgi:hypothetical protein